MENEMNKQERRLNLLRKDHDLEMERKGCKIIDWSLFRKRKLRASLILLGMIIVFMGISYILGYAEAMTTMKEQVFSNYNSSCNAMIEGAKAIMLK